MNHEERFSIDVGVDAIPAAYVRPAGATATVAIAHGAGAGMDHPFLLGVANALNGLGLATLRFDFVYRAKGRRMPGRPAEAIAAWNAVVEASARLAADAAATATEPIWAAGKSYGGRMASMAVADGMSAAGLVYLGYPLHPPGRPEQLRDAHLYGIRVPQLFLQGRNDPFAVPNDALDGVVARIGATAELEWLDDANHSFEITGRKRPAHEIGAGLAPSVARFVGRH